MPSLCRVHAEARRYSPTATNPEQRRAPHSSFARECGHLEARSLVRQTSQRRSASGDLPSQAGGNRSRSAGLSDHHLLRVWILATHVTASQPPVLEDRATTAGTREVSLLAKGRCRPRVCASWGRSCSWLSPWKASLPARDCRASMKTMTCSRRWRGNWSRGTASAIPPTPFGEPSVQNIKSCFPTNSRSDDDALSIEMPGVLLDTQPDPAGLVEGAMDTASIVVFGQRPQSLSGKRRRGRPAVPEQASLFGFS